MNATFGFQYRKVKLFAGIENIFDKQYFRSLSYQRDPFRAGVRVREPGRNLYLNAAYRF